SVSPFSGKKPQHKQNDVRRRRKGGNRREEAKNRYMVLTVDALHLQMVIRAHVGRLLVHQRATEIATEVIRLAKGIQGPAPTAGAISWFARRFRPVQHSGSLRQRGVFSIARDISYAPIR